MKTWKILVILGIVIGASLVAYKYGPTWYEAHKVMSGKNQMAQLSVSGLLEDMKEYRLGILYRDSAGKSGADDIYLKMCIQKTVTVTLAQYSTSDIMLQQTRENYYETLMKKLPEECGLDIIDMDIYLAAPVSLNSALQTSRTYYM